MYWLLGAQLFARSMNLKQSTVTPIHNHFVERQVFASPVLIMPPQTKQELLRQSIWDFNRLIWALVQNLDPQRVYKNVELSKVEKQSLWTSQIFYDILT